MSLDYQRVIATCPRCKRHLHAEDTAVMHDGLLHCAICVKGKLGILGHSGKFIPIGGHNRARGIPGNPQRTV